MGKVVELRPRIKPIVILIDEDDRGLFADVDGVDLRAPNLDALLKLLVQRVKDVRG